MLLEKVQPTDPVRNLILIYGPPTAGKTRLATSLPESFGRIAYIAIDEGSESLSSVLDTYKDRIEVFRPRFNDPVIDSASIAITNWRSEQKPSWYESEDWTGYSTVIVDTFSNLSRLWLWHVTQKGLFQEKRNMVGKPGEEGSVALPDKGHYGGVHGIIRNFITTLFRHNPDTNIILVCHESYNKDDDSGRILMGGPATVGTAMLNELPSNFGTVIRVTSEPGTPRQDPKTKQIVTPNKFVARMAQHGPFLGRLNENSLEGNPLPMLELEIDPINFWRKYEELT